MAWSGIQNGVKVLLLCGATALGAFAFIRQGEEPPIEAPKSLFDTTKDPPIGSRVERALTGLVARIASRVRVTRVLHIAGGDCESCSRGRIDPALTDEVRTPSLLVLESDKRQERLRATRKRLWTVTVAPGVAQRLNAVLLPRMYLVSDKGRILRVQSSSDSWESFTVGL